MLKETKFYFEELFNEEWIVTPIHFAGQEFNAEGKPQWINPSVSPLSQRATGLGGSTQYSFMFYVVCWSQTEVDNMELADAVAQFIDKRVDKTMYSTLGYEIIDNGWQDSNAMFTIMSFEFKTYGGECIVVKTCADSIGGEDGTEFNLDGFWLPSCTIFKG